MTVTLVVCAVLFLLIVVHLARLVAHDGRGSVRAPRSHESELGTWVDRQLRP